MSRRGQGNGCEVMRWWEECGLNSALGWLRSKPLVPEKFPSVTRERWAPLHHAVPSTCCLLPACLCLFPCRLVFGVFVLQVFVLAQLDCKTSEQCADPYHEHPWCYFPHLLLVAGSDCGPQPWAINLLKVTPGKKTIKKLDSSMQRCTISPSAQLLPKR